MKDSNSLPQTTLLNIQRSKDDKEGNAINTKNTFIQEMFAATWPRWIRSTIVLSYVILRASWRESYVMLEI